MAVVQFATPVAHETDPAKYPAYAGKITRGKPYRQRLVGATEGAKVVEGLELLLADDPALDRIFAPFAGTIRWEGASGSSGVNTVRLTVHAKDVAPTLAKLRCVEAPLEVMTFENADQQALRTSLEQILQTNWSANSHPMLSLMVSDLSTKPPKPKTLRDYLGPGPSPSRIGSFLDAFFGAPNPSVTADSGLPVRAGDLLGAADHYAADTSVPPTIGRRVLLRTWDVCGQPIDPVYYLHFFMRQMLLAAGSRVVTSITDLVSAGRLRHPLVDLFPAMNDVVAAAGQVTRASNVVTVAVAGHGLRATQQVKLAGGAGAFSAGAKRVVSATAAQFQYDEPGPDGASAGELRFEPVPSARERYGGVSRFPLGKLATFHWAWEDQTPPAKHFLWRYNPASNIFEAKPVNSPKPALGSTASTEDDKSAIRKLWAVHGAGISEVADALQVPIEAIFALIGAEAEKYAGELDARSLAIEAFQDGASKFASHDRGNFKKAFTGNVARGDYLEKEFDKLVSCVASVTTATAKADGTTELELYFVNTQRWPENKLTEQPRLAWVDQVDRCKIVGNSEALPSTAPVPPGQKPKPDLRRYSVSIQDRLVAGSFVLPRPPGTLGDALVPDAGAYYHAPGKADTAGQLVAPGGAVSEAVKLLVDRDGTFHAFTVKATSNSLSVQAEVSIVRLNASVSPPGSPPTGGQELLKVTLLAGETSKTEGVAAATVKKGDTIAIRVKIPKPAGAKGELKGLSWTFSDGPVKGAEVRVLWPLLGRRVPDPGKAWPGTTPVDYTRSNLTWDDLLDVIDATIGNVVTVGLLQTKPATAETSLNWAIRVGAVLPNPKPANFREYVKTYLANPVNAIWAGAAYMRRGYANGSRFDLPLAAAAHNTGHPTQNLKKPWGVSFWEGYIESAAPMQNSAAELFNAAEGAAGGSPPSSPPALVPLPLVRFMY